MDHGECGERNVTPALRAIASPARIAHPSRVLAKASRLREVFPGSSPAEKDRFGETPKPTPETGALPGHLNALQKKSARGLRQRGSDYRCCIPALAGFVSPQSIAPDGRESSREAGHRAIGFSLALTPVPVATVFPGRGQRPRLEQSTAERSPNESEPEQPALP